MIAAPSFTLVKSVGAMNFCALSRSPPTAMVAPLAVASSMRREMRSKCRSLMIRQ
jgi:hypothetical protein